MTDQEATPERLRYEADWHEPHPAAEYLRAAAATIERLLEVERAAKAVFAQREGGTVYSAAALDALRRLVEGD